MEFPEFAPHCVPFLTDKLTSPIMGTKIDTLDTLERCVKRYDVCLPLPRPSISSIILVVMRFDDDNRNAAGLS